MLMLESHDPREAFCQNACNSSSKPILACTHFHFLLASPVSCRLNSLVDRFLHSCIDSPHLPLHWNLTSAAPLPFQSDRYAHVVYILPLLMKSPIRALLYLSSPSFPSPRWIRTLPESVLNSLTMSLQSEKSLLISRKRSQLIALQPPPDHQLPDHRLRLTSLETKESKMSKRHNEKYQIQHL